MGSSNYAVTKDFSKSWQLRCPTKAAQQERKLLKQSANRKMRRSFKQSGRITKPTTGWSVI